MAKALTEMSNEELWQLFPIVLSEYQSHWDTDYLVEQENLLALIGYAWVIRINHIGSTAIKDLLAKPTIDILLEISHATELAQLIHLLDSAGYIYVPQPQKPAPHMMFMKGYTPTGFAEKVFHLHVRYHGDWDELYFRDYLQQHPQDARQYAELKKQLKEQYEHDRDAYTDAKADFVHNIVKKARVLYGQRYQPN